MTRPEKATAFSTASASFYLSGKQIFVKRAGLELFILSFEPCDSRSVTSCRVIV